MPDQTQQPINLSPPVVVADLSAPNSRTVDEDELARQELARINPSKEKLRALAAKNPPLPKWFDEEEPPPF